MPSGGATGRIPGDSVPRFWSIRELFARSAGESSDVVRKEMYTFKDKGDRSVTLKPESTARRRRRAFLESGLYAQALPMKRYDINAPHFRVMKPPSPGGSGSIISSAWSASARPSPRRTRS